MILSNLALDASSTPTLFELSMANNLASSLRPAFDYVINVFANRGHEWALYANTKKSELFALLVFGVERHYLDEYESSFAENFYGLKRTTSNGQRLTKMNKISSLLEVVLLPYLRSKSHERQIRSVNHAWAVYELVNLVYQLAYLFNRSKYFTPLLRLQRIVVARITGDDVKRFNEKAAAASVTWSANKMRFLVQGFTSAIKYSIIFSVVILRVYEHYNSPESRASREAQQRRFGGLTAPPPPYPPKILPEASQLLVDPRLCPLCGEVRDNPALSTSGYCFCFKCIHRYVEQHHRCPVTGTPCGLLDIRKIYIA